MLHIKPHGHWPFGSRAEDIKRFFTTYGHGGHLQVGHVTSTIGINFHLPIVGSLHMKFEFK